jgi:hypothetical protein
MRSPRLVRLSIAIVVVVLAAVGYALFIPVKVLHPNLLGRLIVPQTNIPTISATPTFAADLPISSTSLKGLQTAAVSSPGETGNYASDWFAGNSSGSSATLQIALVPTASEAKTVLGQAAAEDIDAAALKAGNHKLQTSFTADGGNGVTYLTPQAKKSNGTQGPPVPGAQLDAQFRRVVLRETLSGAVATKANLLGLAGREITLLRRVEPTFPSIQTTELPLTASIVYIVVALLLAAGLALTPDWVRAVRARRQAQHEARMRRQYSTRGSKALRRHRVRL